MSRPTRPLVGVSSNQEQFNQLPGQCNRASKVHTVRGTQTRGGVYNNKEKLFQSADGKTGHCGLVCQRPPVMSVRIVIHAGTSIQAPGFSKGV